MSKIKGLAGDTLLYGLGNILPKALGFFLVTLHTAVFFPPEYGKFTLVSACIVFVNIICTFGMETAFFRFSTKHGAEPKHVFNQVQSVVIAISLPFTIVIAAFAEPIAKALSIPDRPGIILLVAAILFIDAIVAIPFAQLRLRRQPLKYALARIINIVVYIGLSWYFLRVSFDPAIGIGYIFIANLIANGIYVIFFFRELAGWRPVADRQLLTAVLRYGWPIMLGGLAWAVNEMFSRLMLERWLPVDFYGPASKLAALGIFGAAYKFSAIMNLAVQAFRYAAEPFFFSNAAEKNSPELFARVNHYFIVVCCIILVTVSVNMDILKFFLSKPEYWAGVPVVPVLLLAFLFLGLYYNFSVWYKLTDKTYVGTLIFTGGAVLTVVLNYILIPRFGYQGSSWATLIVYFLMAASCYIAGRRFYPIPYRIVRGAAYIIAAAAVIRGSNALEISNPWASTAFHCAVAAAFAGAAFLLERPERISRA